MARKNTPAQQSSFLKREILYRAELLFCVQAFSAVQNDQLKEFEIMI